MRRQGFYAALLGAGALLAAFAPEAPAGERGISVVRAPTGEALRGDNWLLLVAIGKYREWGNLRGPARDVAALKKVLLDRYAFDAARTVELYDEKATKKAIIETFRDLGRRLRPEDSLLLYYAGHGHTDQFSKTGYWIPHDAGADTAMQERWLPNAAVRGYLREMKCSHVLLVSDSCFSGDLLDEQRGELPQITDAYFRRAYEMQARQVLTSGGSEPVSDTGLGGRSAFAFHLVRALERNRAPYLDPTQLYIHIRAGVKDQMPLLGNLKGAGHQDGGAYIFFLREGGRTPSTRTSDSSDAQVKALRRELEALKRRTEAARREGAASGARRPQADDGREAEVERTAAAKAAELFERASAKEKQKDIDGAIGDYTKAIELKPGYVEAYYYRAGLRHRKGDVAAAIADLTKAIEIKPDYALAYTSRGYVHQLEGRKGLARADYTKAATLDPDGEAGRIARRNLNLLDDQ